MLRALNARTMVALLNERGDPNEALIMATPLKDLTSRPEKILRQIARSAWHRNRHLRADVRLMVKLVSPSPCSAKHSPSSARWTLTTISKMAALKQKGCQSSPLAGTLELESHLRSALRLNEINNNNYLSFHTESVFSRNQPKTTHEKHGVTI